MQGLCTPSLGYVMLLNIGYGQLSALGCCNCVNYIGSPTLCILEMGQGQRGLTALLQARLSRGLLALPLGLGGSSLI